MLTDAQARAIGHLTINFNRMESSVDSLISSIVCPRDYGLDAPLIKGFNFSRKLDLVKLFSESLANHYVPSDDNDHAYAAFCVTTKKFIVRARELSKFRNELIHWRYDGLEGNLKVQASAKEIEARSAEMNEIGITIRALAIGLRKGDYSITFGQQFRKGESDRV